mmetsp:Transcript_96684/g.216582  ORF Transcript_96684/g.216582 Transcript_96684/m.216582 type:complete len:191 (-) Transcript_96684:116-688(-)
MPSLLRRPPMGIRSVAVACTALYLLSGCLRGAPRAFTSPAARATSAWHRPVAGLRHQARAAGVARAYSPASVADAWQNHFDAFGAQDVENIMLDYDETSRVTVYNNVDGSKSVFKGPAEVQGMFEGLFKDLSDLATLEAPVIDVDEVEGKGGQVFLVWKCPGCGFDTATDTFIFGADLKIKFQNIVVTKK